MPSTTTVRVTPRTADQIRAITAGLHEETGQSLSTAQTLAYVTDLVAPEGGMSDESSFPDLCRLVERHGLANVCTASASLPHEGDSGDELDCPTCGTPITLTADRVIPVHLR